MSSQDDPFHRWCDGSTPGNGVTMTHTEPMLFTEQRFVQCRGLSVSHRFLANDTVSERVATKWSPGDVVQQGPGCPRSALRCSSVPERPGRAWRILSTFPGAVHTCPCPTLAAPVSTTHIQTARRSLERAKERSGGRASPEYLGKKYIENISLKKKFK